MPGYSGQRQILTDARAAGVRRVVLLSGLSAGTGDRDNAVAGYLLDAEDAVRDSGLAWTFVRPTSSMQSRRKALPSSDRRTLRVLRWNSGAPTKSSSCWMRAVTTDRETRICRAASAKLCDSATRTKASIARNRSMCRSPFDQELSRSARPFAAEQYACALRVGDGGGLEGMTVVRRLLSCLAYCLAKEAQDPLLAL